MLGFFYVLFLAEPSKLSIFSHVYLTITRSNIQLDKVSRESFKVPYLFEGEWVGSFFKWNG